MRLEAGGARRTLGCAGGRSQARGGARGLRGAGRAGRGAERGSVCERGGGAGGWRGKPRPRTVCTWRPPDCSVPERPRHRPEQESPGGPRLGRRSRRGRLGDRVTGEEWNCRVPMAPPPPRRQARAGGARSKFPSCPAHWRLPPTASPLPPPTSPASWAGLGGWGAGGLGEGSRRCSDTARGGLRPGAVPAACRGAARDREAEGPRAADVSWRVSVEGSSGPGPP